MGLKFELIFNIQFSTPESTFRENILEKLFDNRPGLVESNRNHGVHQRSTHLGTVEGMMNWLRRENAQG